MFYVPRRCAFYSIIGISSLSTHHPPQDLVIRSIPCGGRGLYPKCHFRQIGWQISQYAILSQGGDRMASIERPAGQSVNLPTMVWNDTASRESAWLDALA